MKSSITVKEIAWKGLLLNKGRTILSILSTALSVALMIVVLVYFYSDDQWNKRRAINEIGAYHVQYAPIDVNQYEKISNNPTVKKSYFYFTANDLIVEEAKDKGLQMTVMYTDGINDGLIELGKGRAPKSGNEIVMDRWALEVLGLEPETGKKISLTLDGGKGTELFNVVGIMDTLAERKAANSGFMLVSKDFFDEYKMKHTDGAFVLFDTNYQVSGLANRLGKELGLSDSAIQINKQYTNAYETDITTFLSSGAIVLFVLIIGGVVIYNIFHIYISQKIRFFGMLKAIGATPDQLKRLVYLEGLIISICGSILGVAAGGGLSLVSIPFISKGDVESGSIRVEFTPWIIIGAFVLGIALVHVSVRAPARFVSRISEISAIRYNPAQIINRKRKQGKLPLRVSVLLLTIISFSRNRKRTIIAMLSIVLTGLLYLLASSILNSMNIDNMVGQMVQGDYKLSAVEAMRRDKNFDPLNGPFMDTIGAIEGVKDVHTEMYGTLDYNPEDAMRHLPDLMNNPPKNSYIGVDLYGYNDSLLLIAIKSLQSGKVSLEEMKTNHYVIAKTDEAHVYQVGDKIRMKPQGANQDIEFEVVGTVPSYITYKGNGSEGGLLISHQSVFQDVGIDTRLKQISITVDANQDENIAYKIKGLINGDKRIDFTSFKETFEQINGMKNQIALMAYGFIGALSLISVVNLINTTVTGILTRNHEFSMIEAVGQSRKQLRVQLILEGIAVVLAALFIIIVVGLSSGYYVVKLFQVEAEYAIYHLPLKEISILVCTYVFTQILTIVLAEKKLHARNLVERMKMAE